MNRARPFHPVRRLAGIVAGLAAILLAAAAAAPTAFAEIVHPVDGGDGTPLRPVQAVAGGMPGWQITVIALAAAIVAAAVAVIVDRARSARRQYRLGPPVSTLTAHQ